MLNLNYKGIMMYIVVYESKKGGLFTSDEMFDTISQAMDYILARNVEMYKIIKIEGDKLVEVK